MIMMIFYEIDDYHESHQFYSLKMIMMKQSSILCYEIYDYDENYQYYNLKVMILMKIINFIIDNYDYDDDNKNATFQCKYYSSFLCVAVD